MGLSSADARLDLAASEDSFVQPTDLSATHSCMFDISMEDNTSLTKGMNVKPPFPNKLTSKC
jgi:hypothetical protein